MSLILDRPNQKKKLARFCFPSIQNWICVNWKFDYFVSSEKVRERDRKSIEWTNENFINTLTECIVMIFCLFAGYDNDDDSDGGGNRLSIEMFSRRISEFFFVPVVEW